MQALGSEATGLTGLWRADDGAAAVEFALMAPILSVILLGGIDVAIAARAAMSAQATAEATAAAIVRLVPAPAPDATAGSNTASFALTQPPVALPALPAVPAAALAGVASPETSARLFWACATGDPAVGMVLRETSSARCPAGDRPAAHVEVRVGVPPSGLGLASAARHAGLAEATLVTRLG